MSAWTRRRFVSATAAIMGTLGLASVTGADDHRRSFVAEQDGECLPVEPLEGDEPVEAFYDWGRDVLSWSSEGTRELQRSETSILFLYRGPLGLSLVAVHDRADDGTPGGVASFTFEGVPEDAEWAVKDDLYEMSSNVDTWEINGTVLEANETTVTDEIPDIDGNETVAETNETDDETETESDDDGDTESTREDEDDTPADGTATEYDERTDEIAWFWTTGRTDGGALRGLAVDGLELEIEVALDEEAELDTGSYEREITTWTLLSGDREDPDRTELDPEETLVLRTGTCESDGKSEETATEAEEAAETEDGDEEDSDEEAEADSDDEEDMDSDEASDADSDEEGDAEAEAEADAEADESADEAEAEDEDLMDEVSEELDDVTEDDAAEELLDDDGGDDE